MSITKKHLIRCTFLNESGEALTEDIHEEELRTSLVKTIKSHNPQKIRPHYFKISFEKQVFRKELDLSNIDYPLVLVFKACTFEKHISLRNTSIVSLELEGSTIETLDAFGLKTQHHLYLSKGFHSKGTIQLINAKIGGRLSLRGGKFHEGNFENFKTDNSDSHIQIAGAIQACGLKVAGSLYMDEDPEGTRAWELPDGVTFDNAKFESHGLVTLRGAEIGARWYANGALMYSAYERCDGADKPIWNRKAGVSHYINCFASLEAYSITVKGSAHFGEHFTSFGLIRLSSAHFHRKLSFRGAKLIESAYASRWCLKKIFVYARRHVPRGCLDLFGATISGSFYITKTYSSTQSRSSDSLLIGIVTLKGANIGGRVVIRKSNFCAIASTYVPEMVNYSYRSLDISNCTIGGTLYIRESNFFGTICMTNLRLSSRLGMFDTHVLAINAVGGEKLIEKINDAITKTKLFRKKQGSGLSLHYNSQKNLKALKAKISSDKEEYKYPELHRQFMALDAENINVDGSLSIKGYSSFYGLVNLKYSEIKTHISLYNTTFRCAAGKGWENNFPELIRLLYAVAIDGDNTQMKSLRFAHGQDKNRVSDYLDSKFKPLHGMNVIGKVTFHYANVDGPIDIRARYPIEWRNAELHLESASCLTLVDNEFSCRAFRYKNFTYDAIHRDSLRVMQIRERVERISMRYGKDTMINGVSTLQPLEQLAKVYNSMGLQREVDYVLNDKLKCLVGTEYIRPDKVYTYDERNEIYNKTSGKVLPTQKYPLRRKGLTGAFLRLIFHTGYGLGMAAKATTGYIMLLSFWGFIVIPILIYTLDSPLGSIRELFAFAVVPFHRMSIGAEISPLGTENEIIITVICSIALLSKAATYILTALLAWGLLSNYSARKPTS